MSIRAARNNILAGGFVVVAMALGVWASFQLSSVPPMSGLTRFTVRFSLADGAAGLKQGSDVLLAGQKIGRVLSVNFVQDGGVPTGVDVEVETRADVTLYEDAGVYLQLPLLGTLSSINVTEAGSPGAAPFTGTSAAIESGDRVTGHLAPPAFLAQAGFGAAQAAQLRSSITALEAGISRATKLLDKSSPLVEGGLGDAQKLLAQLRIKVEEWSKLVDATAANIERASGRLDPLMTKAETGLDGAIEAIEQVRGLVAENRSKLGTIMDNVQSATGKIDQKTIDEVNSAIAAGRDALETFSGALTGVSRLVKEESPSVRRTIANLRLMSDQLKLTAVEVRSQPWRALHSPTNKELSTQVLYDATRAYAEASSDLRGAAEALAAADTPEAAAELSAYLREKMDTYKAAEKALMDRLITAEGK